MVRFDDKHKELNDSIKKLFYELGLYPRKIKFTGTVYNRHSQVLDWINLQIFKIKNAYDSLIQGNTYASSFCTLRSVWENYWILTLVVHCKIHNQFWESDDPSIVSKTYEMWETKRIAGELDNDKSEVAKIRKISKKRICVTFRKKNLDRPTWYWNIYQNYNGIDHWLGKRNLFDPYFTHLKNKDKKLKQMKDISDFFYRKGLEEHLLMNNIITQDDIVKLDTHYNFLSLWIHPNHETNELIKYRFGFGSFERYNEVDNPLLKRLCLLYICKLLILFSSLLQQYLSSEVERGFLKGENSVNLNQAIKNAKNSSHYFWFIFNEPHYNYKYMYCCNKMYENGEFTIYPHDLNDKMMYYKHPLDYLNMIFNPSYYPTLGPYEFVE